MPCRNPVTTFRPTNIGKKIISGLKLFHVKTDTDYRRDLATQYDFSNFKMIYEAEL